MTLLRGSTADATLSITNWSMSSRIMVFICCAIRTTSSFDNLGVCGGGTSVASVLRVATSVL